MIRLWSFQPLSRLAELRRSGELVEAVIAISEDAVAHPTRVTVQLLIVQQDGTRPPVNQDQCTPTSEFCS